jgi:hypothetical protein
MQRPFVLVGRLPGRPDQARLWGLGLGCTACGEHWPTEGRG